MSNFALRLLYNDVKALFVSDQGPDVNVVFGRRQPPQQTNTHTAAGHFGRVVFAPGDPSGKMGKYGPPKTARVPFGEHRRRAVATLFELATVYCLGFDPSAPNDEAAQYEAARLIHDYVIRAIYRSPNVGHGSYTLGDPQWLVPEKERKWGAECFFVIALEARIPDEAPDPPGDILTLRTTASSTPEIAVDTTADPVVYEADAPDLTAPDTESGNLATTLAPATLVSTAHVV